MLNILRKEGIRMTYITLNCASVDMKIFEDMFEEHDNILV